MNYTDQFLDSLQAAKAARLNTVSAIHTLLLISKADEGTTPTVLAEQVKITIGGMTQLLDTLVSMKLVNREINPKDRRQFLCTITDTGLETLAKILPCHSSPSPL